MGAQGPSIWLWLLKPGSSGVEPELPHWEGLTLSVVSADMLTGSLGVLG